jgi:hypothetical protein
MESINKFKKKRRGHDAPAAYFFEKELRDPDLYRKQTLYGAADSLEWERMFELSALTPEKQLEGIRKEIKIRVRITKNEIFKIGELLIYAKKICQQEGKGFQEWIDKNLDFSYETANNFMNVYEQCFGQRFIAMKVKPSILYRISAPNFPDELREYLFDSGKLDEMTNGQLREITWRYKEGGFEAIKDDIQELSRINLVVKQSSHTLDMIENALRTLEDLKEKIEKRGRSGPAIIPFEDAIKAGEPEAVDINAKLYTALESAIDILDKVRDESVDILSNMETATYEKCGLVESDGRIEKKEKAENVKFTEMEILQMTPPS